MRGAVRSMALVTEPTTTRDVVGWVANGQVRALSSGTLSEEVTRLTSVALRGAAAAAQPP
jgi:hypothetical protein